MSSGAASVIRAFGTTRSPKPVELQSLNRTSSQQRHIDPIQECCPPQDYQTRTFFNEDDDGILQVQCQLTGTAVGNKVLKVTLYGERSEILAAARATAPTKTDSMDDGPGWCAAPSIRLSLPSHCNWNHELPRFLDP